MILNDTDIQAAVGEFDLISPFNKSNLSGASYDVTLHHLIKIENQNRGLRWIYHDLLDDGQYKIEPGEFILAAINEVITIPLDMACEFKLKSSRQREGFTQTGNWADPGYHGRLTLELSNVNRYNTVTIRPGMKIGQLVFHRLTKPATIDYAKTGHYQGDMQVQESKVNG